MKLATFYRLLTTRLSQFTNAKINVIYLSNKARGGVVYGQYTTTKGCSYAIRNTECLDTVLSCRILAIYAQTPEMPYCYYKLFTNVKNKCFVIPVVYSLIYHGCQPISIYGSNYPVYKYLYFFCKLASSFCLTGRKCSHVD